MINEILCTGDLLDQSYTILFSLDFSKAFNKFSHQKIMQSLIGLGLRKSLIPLVASYLQNRSLIVRWKESFSKKHFIRGGCGQGTILAVLLFAIATNYLGLNWDLIPTH